jgi:hypothetical protein
VHKKNAQIVIFEVDGYPNHCGIYFQEYGLFDNSFIGTRCIKFSDPKYPKGVARNFEISVPKPKNSVTFFRKLMKLPDEIIQMERDSRGWHLSREAPDYVLNLRKTRSRDTASMNCVEWILYGLELGDLILPSEILTPNQLLNWCTLNLKNVTLPSPKG